MFLQRGVIISCTVTGEKRYSRDLPQGGLEITCQLKFTGNDKDVSKNQKLVKGFLNKASSSCGEQNNKLTEQKASVKNASEGEATVITVDDVIPAAKRRKISESAAVMTNEDLEAIIMGCKLSDIHISQVAYETVSPSLNGLASTLLITKDIQISKSVDNKIQIFHSRKDHWITASSVACDPGKIKVYDSSFTSLDATTEILIHKEFQSPVVKSVINTILYFQRQKGDKDCGLFAIACATSIAFGIDPAKQKFGQDSLRSHFIKCIKEENFPLFPTY